MHATDDGGTVAGIRTASCSIRKLCDHPRQTDDQTDQHAVKRTLSERSGRSHTNTQHEPTARSWFYFTYLVFQSPVLERAVNQVCSLEYLATPIGTLQLVFEEHFIIFLPVLFSV